MSHRQPKLGLGGREQGAVVPLACPCLGWARLPPPSRGWLPSGSRCWWCCGLGIVLCWFLAHCPPLPFCAFLKSVFSLYSTCIWCMFLHGDNNSSTSGNTLVVMYMCVETCSYSPFWMNVGGINVSIRTANTPLGMVNLSYVLLVGPIMLSYCLIWLKFICCNQCMD
jgi:hypothetical protein